MPGLAKRVPATEAALSAERFTLVAENEKAREALQKLQIAWTIAAEKEQELE